METLERGVRLFPRRTELVFRVAELNVRRGDQENARWLIALGLTFAHDAENDARFAALRTRLEATR
jgi:hypothetical protein